MQIRKLKKKTFGVPDWKKSLSITREVRLNRYKYVYKISVK